MNKTSVESRLDVRRSSEHPDVKFPLCGSRGPIPQMGKRRSQTAGVSGDRDSDSDGAAVAIAPGRFPTEMTKAISDDAARLKAEEAMIPLGRWGRGDDIAGAAVFFALRAGSYVNGAILPVDGGVLLTAA